MNAPIIEAIKTNRLDKVIDILLRDPSAIETRDEDGTWAPFIAAQIGDLAMIKYIVEYSRASMNTVDENNNNILHFAVESDEVKTVSYLIDRVGMNPCAGNRQGETPIDRAVKKACTKVVQYFREEKGLKLENMYHNPIVTGAHPDPSVIRVGEDYYMVNSSFTFFPCIPILHSKDLINWKIIGHAVTERDYLNIDDLEDGRGIWAPDISYHKGRFYIVATYRLNDGGPIYRKQMVVSSDQPQGPYSKPVFLEEDGIDPSLFTDDDGKRYMLLNRGARIFEVSEDCSKQLSKAELLWYGDNKRAPEGPHLLKKDGYYYLFMAEGGTGPNHCITVARSRHLMGPYEPSPHNPIMIQTRPLEYIQRAGHGKPIQTQNGEWYMIYLCGRRIGEGYCILGRETSMDPIEWTLDGWPIINKGRGPSVLQHKPKLEMHLYNKIEKDDFDDNKLGLDWMFMRQPEEDGYYLKDSHLFIKSTNRDLNSRAAKNFVVQRQKHFCFKVETKLQLSQSLGLEAGLVAYYDTLTYLKFGIVQKEDIKVLQVTERIGSKECIPFEHPLRETYSNLYLQMHTDFFKRSFYYSLDGVSWHNIGILENVYYLSDEGINEGKRFTGTMIGLYAINRKKVQQEYIGIDYFKYII